LQKRERVKLKWFLATSGGGVEEMVFVKKRERVVCKRERERVKLKWFLATSGGGVEEMVFVKERENCSQKERE
jgi:hypothetical protein